jgi:hypothetical protein
VPRQSEDASRARFQARARVLRDTRRRTSGIFPRVSRVMRAATLSLAVLAGVTLGLFGAVTASAQSIPGDPLYEVKRAAERVQLAIAPDAAARRALAEQFEERRRQEAAAVAAQGRLAAVEFTGQIEAQAGIRWTIAGLDVIVPPELGAGLSVGQTVAVRGATQVDGAILALRLEDTGDTPPAPTATPTETSTALPTATGTPTATATVSLTATRTVTRTPSRTATTTLSASDPSRTPSVVPSPVPTSPAPSATPGSGGSSGPSPSNTPQPTATPHITETDEPDETDEPEEVEFSGIVQSTGAVWVISGQSVVITAETRFEDNPGLGDRVKVQAWRFQDGTLVAREIEKE